MDRVELCSEVCLNFRLTCCDASADKDYNLIICDGRCEIDLVRLVESEGACPGFVGCVSAKFTESCSLSRREIEHVIDHKNRVENCE